MRNFLKSNKLLVIAILTIAGVAFQQFNKESLQTARIPAVDSSIQEYTGEVQESEFVLSDAEDTPPAPPLAVVDDGFEVPTPEIMGADKPFNVGDIIQLWIKPSAKPDNLYSVQYSWTVLPAKKIIIWPDSSRVIFGTGSENTTYVVVLTASYVFTKPDEEGKVVGIEQRTKTQVKAVQVVGGKDGGGNGGGGTDWNDNGGGGTDWNGGDGGGGGDVSLSGLQQKSYSWVKAVKLSPSYGSSQVQEDAVRLAASFRLIASKINSGEYMDVPTILKNTKVSNDTAVSNRDAWLDWFKQLSSHLSMAYGNNTIKSMDQFQRAWIDIAIGLEASAK